MDQSVSAQFTGEILPLVAGLVVWGVVFLLLAPRAAGSSLLLFVAAVDGHVSHGFQKSTPFVRQEMLKTLLNAEAHGFSKGWKPCCTTSKA